MPIDRSRQHNSWVLKSLAVSARIRHLRNAGHGSDVGQGVPTSLAALSSDVWIMRPTIAVAVLCLASLSGPGWSQQVDGNLEGRILDASGKPLAYVNVAVSGPSLQGVRNALSDRQGYPRCPRVRTRSASPTSRTTA